MTTDALDAAELSPADAFEQGIVPVLDEVCRAVDQVRVDPWIVAGATVAIGNISELALAPKLAPRPRFALACPCTTRLAWRHLPSTEPVRFGSRPRSRSTRLSRLAPSRPQPWASPCSAARAYDERALHPAGSQRLYPRLRQLPPARPQAVAQEYRRQGHAGAYRRPRPLAPVRCLPHRPHAAGPQLLDAGVRRLMVDGTLLEADEIGRAVARVRRAIEAVQAGRKPAARLRGATSGCMFVGIS